MRQQKPCIFCNRLGDKSKEHFYPAWLGEHIDGNGFSNTSFLLSKLGESPATLESRSRRQGHLITKKLRVVCKTCNNEWMSQLETEAKDILISGLCGQHVELSPERQRALVSWILLKSLVSEHSEPQLASTPFVDRHAFYSTRVVPDYFRLYVGIHSTGVATWFYRHSIALSFSEPISPPLLDGLQRNTQTITFIFGHFVFHVLAARVSNFRLDHDLTYPGLTRLWPGNGCTLNTAQMRVLTGSQIALIANSLEHYLAKSKVRYIDAVI